MRKIKLLLWSVEDNPGKGEHGNAQEVYQTKIAQPFQADGEAADDT